MKYLFPAFTFICLLSCEEEPILPRATQIGANTFGCLVNGRVWVPKERDGSLFAFVGKPPLEFTYSEGYFAIAANNDINDDQTQYIHIFFNEISDVGNYDLKSSNNQRVAFWDDRNCNYESDDGVTDCTGALTITKLDLNEAIISGEFSFTMTKQNCETIKVTDGRFDMKL